MTDKHLEAWHFLRDGCRFGYGDGNLAAPGYVYSVKGPVKLCEWGLHASVRPIDALQFAPGAMVGRVVLSGEVIEGDDKLVATHREYLWIADATETLRSFARWSALQVIHLWDAPDVVRRYLKSGDESLRAAAGDAARAAAWDLAKDAARDLTKDAAWSAARAAAWPATWDLAWSAAWTAAWTAARAAQKDAAWDDQNTELEKRLLALGAK